MNKSVIQISLFMKRKGIIASVSALGLLICGGTIIYALKISNQLVSNTAPSVLPTPTFKAVTALGRLEPQGGVIKVAPPPDLGGAKVSRLLIQEGDILTAGQIIAILDSLERKQATAKSAQESVKVAQANLDIIQSGAKKGDIAAQKANVQRFKTELDGQIAINRAKLARLEAQLRGEKQTLSATIALLKADLDNAEREFHRYQVLAKQGAISASDLDEHNLTFERARESFKQAEANYHKIVTVLTEEIKEAQADAQKTTASLRQQILEATAKLESVSEVRQVEVKKAQSELDRTQAELGKAQADLDLAYVKAPFGGQIIKINTHAGEKVGSDGIVELGNTDRMIVIAEVYESDINKIRIGQRAKIKSQNNTFNGELSGKVSKIGLQIGKEKVFNIDPSADVDTRVIEVEISLDPQSSYRVSQLTYTEVFTQIILD